MVESLSVNSPNIKYDAVLDRMFPYNEQQVLGELQYENKTFFSGAMA